MKDSDSRLRVGWRGRGKGNTQAPGKDPVAGKNGVHKQSNNLSDALMAMMIPEVCATREHMKGLDGE